MTAKRFLYFQLFIPGVDFERTCKHEVNKDIKILFVLIIILVTGNVNKAANRNRTYKSVTSLFPTKSTELKLNILLQIEATTIANFN